jgi:alanine racemase
MHTRPVWAEISRRNLIANYLELCRIAAIFQTEGGATEILAVVKADAYGHDLRLCAPALTSVGAKWIGVTSVEEGVAAREICPVAGILIMSGIFEGEAAAVVEHRLTPLVWEGWHIDRLEAAAVGARLPPRSLPVHLELDTGMARQGVRLDNSLTELLDRLHESSPLRLDGIATHFSSPEVMDSSDTDDQLVRFETAVELIAQRGFRPRWIHAGNSATVLRVDHIEALHRIATRLGAQVMIRPGLSLYGYPPRFVRGGEGAAAPEVEGLLPVLEWKTRVTSLRQIGEGEAAGYNSTFRARRPSRLALVPLGYADGLGRLLSNRGSMLVRGQRAAIAGRVSMDQTILDVTEIPGVTIGDEVIVIGRQGAASISADEIADLTGTIPYEILCAIASRVPRIAID